MIEVLNVVESQAVFERCLVGLLLFFVLGCGAFVQRGARTQESRPKPLCTAFVAVLLNLFKLYCRDRRARLMRWQALKSLLGLRVDGVTRMLLKSKPL